MIAVFKTGGKQYSVKKGQVLKVEKLKGKKGDNFSFKDVLVLSDGSNNTIGNPTIKGALIKAKILDQIREKKIIVFKKRKRKNYRSTHGHRQYLTVVKIESISNESKKTIIETTSKNIDSKKVKSSIKPKSDIKEKAVEKSVAKKALPKKKTKKKLNIKKSSKKKQQIV